MPINSRPPNERETVDGCLRHVDFLASEIAVLDKSIARTAIDDQWILRLMTVPGTSVITASTFVAAIGEIRRFNTVRQLVGYLSLDSRVRQSGCGSARPAESVRSDSVHEARARATFSAPHIRAARENLR